MSERRGTSPVLMVWMGATYLFLYAPILVLAVFSFNDSRLLTVWRGFTWRWYKAVLDNQPMLEALRTSLLIAALTTLVATLLGTSAALAFERWRGRARPLVEALFVLPIVVPEVVVGFASVIFFGGIGMRLGLGTVLLAHVAFSISYVFFVVRARLATAAASGFETMVTLEQEEMARAVSRALEWIKRELALPLPASNADMVRHLVAQWPPALRVSAFHPEGVWSESRSPLGPLELALAFTEEDR